MSIDAREEEDKSLSLSRSSISVSIWRRIFDDSMRSLGLLVTTAASRTHTDASAPNIKEWRLFHNCPGSRGLSRNWEAGDRFGQPMWPFRNIAPGWGRTLVSSKS